MSRRFTAVPVLSLLALVVAGTAAASPQSRPAAGGRARGVRASGSLPPGAFAQLGGKLGGDLLRYAGRVETLAFAPDGKTLASAGKDGRVRLGETATGREVRAFAGQPERVRLLGFCEGGKTLLALGGEVVLWDAATGKELRRRPVPPEHFDPRTWALSPARRQLALGEVESCKYPPKTELRVLLWDLEGDRWPRACRGAHDSSVTALAFSPDGKRLASSGWDRTVCVWEAATGQEVARRRGDMDGGHRRIAFADDGKSVLVCSALERQEKPRFQVVRWEPATGKERVCLLGPSPGAALFCPRGRTLACVSQPDALDLWRTDTGKRTRLRAGLEGFVMPIAFSPDGRVLATWHGEGTVFLWDVGK
jgi:WD40 repeat protein